MADTRSKTILLLGDAIYKEAKSTAATILPGHLIQKVAAGTVQKHGTAAGNAQRMFAVEDEGQGKTISDLYVNSTLIKYVIPVRGAEINAVLANGQNVAIGDPLESNGDGTLRKHVADIDDNDSVDITTIYTECIVGYAMNAVDMSGSNLVDPDGRVRVEIA